MIATLAVASLLAGPAFGAARSCEGEAKGAHNESVQVRIDVAADGSAGEREATWSPPSSGASPFPMLMIDYTVDDGKLGAITGVSISAMIDAKQPPHSPAAVILMKLDGDAMWSHEWGMYHQNIANLHSTKGLPPGAQPAGFFGVVPMAFAGAPGNPARNVDLIQALTTAHAATILIGGHGDGPQPKIEEMIAGNKFDFDDKAARDVLFHTAWDAAAKAAQKPASCGKAQQ
jgi:hypothetical protein